MIPAAVAAVVISAGGAKAQTVVAPGTTTPGMVVPTNPNSGFATGFNSIDPRLQFNGGSLGFTPGVTPGNSFTPATGFGFSSPFGFGYTPWYNNPANDGYLAMLNQQAMLNNMRRSRGGLAIAGLNSPPLQPGPYRRVAIRNGGSGSGYDQQSQQRADELAQDNAAIQIGSTDPQQIRLANRMESVMLNQPLTEGTVVGKQDGGVLVRFDQDGERKTRRFEPAQVFHFSASGRLATANTGSMVEGTSVLVPLPASRVERQAVAGSRQTYSAAPHKKARKR